MCGKSEASGESSRLTKQAFHKKTGVVFQSAAFAVPCGGGGLSRTVFLIVTAPWSPVTPVPLATRARWSRGAPCVDCMGPLALARQPKSAEGRTCSPASARQRENILTTRAPGFQQCIGTVPCHCAHVGFRLGTENAMATCAHLPQPRSGGILHLPTLSGFSKAVG